MKPTTRLETSRQQVIHRTRLSTRRMDPSIFNKYAHNPAYNTRSSPKKKGKGKELARRVSWKWDDDRRAMFYTLCVDEVHNGMRSGASLKPEALNRVGRSLSEAFGDTCLGSQVRNFWNQQKGLWATANALRSATGLGFDPFNDTISADDEWWDEAIKVLPDAKSLRNKNIVELLNYGDVLFKNVTATGEHVTYPANACGQQDLASMTDRLDLNSVPEQGGDGGSCYRPSTSTPASGSTRGSKRKSVATGPSKVWKKAAPAGARLIEAFDVAYTSKVENQSCVPDIDACMPFLDEICDINEELFMYGATLLGGSDRYVKTFLSMATIEKKVRWLLYMQRKGFQ